MAYRRHREADYLRDSAVSDAAGEPQTPCPDCLDFPNVWADYWLVSAENTDLKRKVEKPTWRELITMFISKFRIKG